jgi:hypothetical protein
MTGLKLLLLMLWVAAWATPAAARLGLAQSVLLVLLWLLLLLLHPLLLPPLFGLSVLAAPRAREVKQICAPS